jgi:hypothetical protein
VLARPGGPANVLQWRGGGGRPSCPRCR